MLEWIYEADGERIRTDMHFTFAMMYLRKIANIRYSYSIWDVSVFPPKLITSTENWV